MKTNLIGYAFMALLLYICIKIYQDSDTFNLNLNVEDLLIPFSLFAT